MGEGFPDTIMGRHHAMGLPGPEYWCHYNLHLQTFPDVGELLLLCLALKTRFRLNVGTVNSRRSHTACTSYSSHASWHVLCASSTK